MRSKRSRLADILIILLCLLGFGMSLFLFWRDMNTTLDRQGEEPVGSISFRYNTAQRRFADRTRWDRLRDTSPIYNGDIIRTANLSEATITSASGDMVNVHSNTMLQISMGSNGLLIDFSEGRISADNAD